MWQLLIFTIFISSVSADFSPQVAFRCGKPSIYLALDRPQRGGWIRDDAQGCVDRLEDVLAFCKRVYPKLAANLTGVVPSADVVTIHNWCGFKKLRCEGRSHNTHLTRPFKCLSTGFVPEALLVPDRCSFGHFFSPAERTDCRSLAGWRKLASSECAGKAGNPNLHSMGVLTPCPEGAKNTPESSQAYAGVEFVCCPKDVEDPPRAEAYVVNSGPAANDRPLRQTAPQHRVVALHATEAAETKDPNEIVQQDEEEDDDEEETDPAPAGLDSEKFLAAELALRKEEEEEEADLAREFEEAMTQLATVREGKDGERDFARLRLELIKRFQQKFGRAISDQVAKERILDLQHERSVHEKLQRRLDAARRILAQRATALEPQLEDVWAALSAFLRLALSSEIRALHHFSRLLIADPPEAARQRSVLHEHFARMQRAVANAVSESGHAPKLEAKLRQRADNFAKSFSDLNASMRALLDASARVKVEGNDDDSGRSALERQGKARLASILAPYLHPGKVKMTRRKAVIFADGRDPNAIPIPRDVSLDVTNGAIEEEEEEEDEDERTPGHHSVPAVDPRLAMAGVKNMAMHHSASGFSDESPVAASPSAYRMGSIIGGLVASMAMLLLVLVVVLAVRHRQERPHAGYVMSVVELDPQDEQGGHGLLTSSGGSEAVGPRSCDDRHLASMQINGYENPTYRYFDKQ